MREIRQGFAALGLSLESLDDLKPIATAGAKFFLSLKLDNDKKEVQRVSLAAAKTLLLLGDKDGSSVILSACERAKGTDENDRVAALRLLGIKDTKALKKAAFDSSHSLYGEARVALASVCWNLPEFQENLPKLDPAKLGEQNLHRVLSKLGLNWAALTTTEKDLEALKMWPAPAHFWVSASGTAGGAADFGWTVPYLIANGKRGIAAVGMVRKDTVLRRLHEPTFHPPRNLSRRSHSGLGPAHHG